MSWGTFGDDLEFYNNLEEVDWDKSQDMIYIQFKETLLKDIGYMV